MNVGPMAETEAEAAARVQAFRAARIARLTSETGWLTLVGRHLLEPGDNQLPFGVVTLNAASGAVRLTVAPGAEVSLRGSPLRGRDDVGPDVGVVAGIELRPDVDGGPDPIEHAGLI